MYTRVLLPLCAIAVLLATLNTIWIENEDKSAMPGKRRIEYKFEVALRDVWEDAEGRIIVQFLDGPDTVFPSWDRALQGGLSIHPEDARNALNSGVFKEWQWSDPSQFGTSVWIRDGGGVLSVATAGPLLGWGLLQGDVGDVLRDHWHTPYAPWGSDPEAECKQDWEAISRLLGISTAWETVSWEDIEEFERKLSDQAASRRERRVVRGALAALGQLIRSEVGGSWTLERWFGGAVPAVATGQGIVSLQGIMAEWAHDGEGGEEGESLHELWEAQKRYSSWFR